MSRITVETRSDGTTVASELFATYPSRLHLTKLPHHKDEHSEQCSLPKALNCYVLGYGGGLISGDVNELSIDVKENAKLVVTSQSTSKAFKAVSGRDATCIRTKAKVDRGGLLFLVPQPMQCFAGSVLTLETEVVLEGLGMDSNMTSQDDPSLLLVDWYTGGRKKLDGGLWQLSSYHSRTRVFIRGLERESKLVFRDATRLSGGRDLQRHMRNFNVVCMVVLMGPKVKDIATQFLETYSSRRAYDENEAYATKISTSNVMDYNHGEGLNGKDEGLLVSCGTFPTCEEGRYQTGVVVRLAATTLEIAAQFLSKHIGTLGGHLDDDPFLEILVSKQGFVGSAQCKAGPEKGNSHPEKEPMSEGEKFPMGLIANSYKTLASVPKVLANDNPSPDPLTRSGTSKNDGGYSIRPLTLYQLIDSCVPSGGFAHSNTLEAAYQLHLLDSSGSSSWTHSLSNHIWDVVLNTVTSSLPFLLSSCRLFRNHGGNDDNATMSSLNTKDDKNANNRQQLPMDSFCAIAQWEKLDAMLRASTTSHVASRASSTQGSGMLRAFASSFYEISPILKALKRCALKVHNSLADFTGHGATCFGAVCGLLNIDDETCCSMFLYTVLRDMVNAAVRMNLVGPLEGGRLIHDLCTAVEILIRDELSHGFGFQVKNAKENHHTTRLSEYDCFCTTQQPWDVECAHQVCPLIEILSNAHDRLYTRLFNS